jgi:hypothetical protein
MEIGGVVVGRRKMGRIIMGFSLVVFFCIGVSFSFVAGSFSKGFDNFIIFGFGWVFLFSFLVGLFMWAVGIYFARSGLDGESMERDRMEIESGWIFRSWRALKFFRDGVRSFVLGFKELVTVFDSRNDGGVGGSVVSGRGSGEIGKKMG